MTVTTARGSFTRQADEALGSRIVPLDDAGLQAKFLDLVGPVFGPARAKELMERVWSVEEIGDVAPLVGVDGEARVTARQVTYFGNSVERIGAIDRGAARVG